MVLIFVFESKRSVQQKIKCTISCRSLPSNCSLWISPSIPNGKSSPTLAHYPSLKSTPICLLQVNTSYYENTMEGIGEIHMIFAAVASNGQYVEYRNSCITPPIVRISPRSFGLMHVRGSVNGNPQFSARRSRVFIYLRVYYVTIRRFFRIKLGHSTSLKPRDYHDFTFNCLAGRCRRGERGVCHRTLRITGRPSTIHSQGHPPCHSTHLRQRAQFTRQLWDSSTSRLHLRESGHQWEQSAVDLQFYAAALCELFLC